MKDNIGLRIKQLRIKLGLSQAKFAAKTGISVGGVCELEKGKMGLQSKTIIRICKAFNIDPAWLLWGSKKHKELPSIVAEPKEKYESKKLTAIPVINEVPASYPDYPILDDFQRDFVYVSGVPRCSFGLIVVGNSMSPDLKEDDIVIIDPTFPVHDLKSGDMGVFRVDNEPKIKYYILSKRGGCILQSTNPEHPPIILADETECHLIGKVIYKIIKC